MHLIGPILRGRWGFVVSCCLLFGGGFGISADSTSAGIDLRTDHYILYVETLDPPETGRLLEAAYAEMKTFFHGMEPNRKLQVRIYATKDRYQSERDRLSKSLGVKLRGGHPDGFYLRQTACAYLYVTPEEYETRRLLLHEVAHEYHDFIRPWSTRPTLEFCEEGIAEYLALHSWDGRVLRLGLVPPISKPDYAKTALRQLQNTARFDLGSIVDGDTELDYHLAWGLVGFLIDQRPEKFDTWRRGVDNGVDPRVVWQKQFGAVTPEFRQSFETWLKSNASPWQAVSGEWRPSGESIEGLIHEEEFAIAILDQTPREFTVTLGSSDSGTIGGAVFGFRGAKNFHVVQHCPDGHWDVMHYDRTYFPKAEHRIFPAKEGSVNITVAPGEGITTLKFDGQTVTVTNAAGHVGLWVKEGRQRFKRFNVQ